MPASPDAPSERGEGSRPPISGVVICCDEEVSIERCLASLQFCDEIVVVDSGSRDRTVEIARRFTDRVIDQPFLGYVEQKNFALEQAKHDWVVSLDADEALSAELQQEIQDALRGDDGSVYGYRLDRVTHYLGTWHDYGEWHPDWQLRVFRRSRGRWTGRNPHDRIQLEGPVGRLTGRLEHWTYENLAEHVRTIDRFSTEMARSLAQDGVRFRMRDLLFRPPARFLKGFVLRGGFRKGLPGFLVSVATSFYVFMKYAKLWELERRERR